MNDVAAALKLSKGGLYHHFQSKDEMLFHIMNHALDITEERVVKAVRAGIVWVNHMQPTYVEAPWGGYKQSGFGRELGPWGIEEYLETKQVHINLNESPIGWY